MARWLELDSHTLSPRVAQRSRELGWKNRGRLWLSPPMIPWGVMAGAALASLSSMKPSP